MDGTRVVHESFLICLYRTPYFHGLNVSPSHCRSLFSFLFAFEASDLSLFLLLISGVFNFFCFSFNYINYLVDLLREKIKKMKESAGNPLHLKSVNHVSLVCRNISESIDFYQNVLGFVPIRRPGSFNFDGAW